uniref:Uncharacterized protein n=1 Tax=Stegastes partitus TaxID=144197 RepID=A0A3B4Z279_9TELE
WAWIFIWIFHKLNAVFLLINNINSLSVTAKISFSTTTTSSPAAVSFTTGDVSGSSQGSTSVSFTQKFSSDDVKTVTASVPLNHVTSTGSHLSASDNWQTSVSRDSTGESSHTTSEATNTTDWISVSNTTENSTSFNGTGSSDSNMRRGSQGNASLLVLLVTCLIFGLLVVVIFFAIKLRRAHMAWKRENEDSVPSEESSKSKSSQEEKGFPGQRKRALNTAFTQYVNEKPTTITIIAPPESVNKEQTLQPQTSTQTSATNDIKETSL